MLEASSANVLLVDSDRVLSETMTSALRKRGVSVSVTTTAEAALAALDGGWDVVATDVHAGGTMNGLAFCERVVTTRPDVPVIVMSAVRCVDTAIAAFRAGAHDFVTRPVDVDVLVGSVQRAVRRRTLRSEVKRLRVSMGDSGGVEGIIGSSPAIRRAFELIDRVADTDATVLVTGKSGTGKELVARALHQRSRRADGPFVAINCAAIPEQLLESELFGHVKGAFTDARTARKGLFLKASGGTIFLDEIGELPVSMQPKLLRALQEKKVRPVGGDHEEPFEARLVTATNRDLEAEVAQGRFREDLFYRINVVRIDVPPLQRRGNDVLLIAQHFVTRIASRLQKRVTGLSTAAAEKLLAYRWPGNVRELENCIERAVALAAYDEVTVDDLPERVRDFQAPDLQIPGVAPNELLSMEEVERRHILRVLEAVGGSKSAAAQVLGLDRSTLYRKLDQYSHASGQS